MGNCQKVDTVTCVYGHEDVLCVKQSSPEKDCITNKVYTRKIMLKYYSYYYTTKLIN